jgi:hypothetical protein
MKMEEKSSMKMKEPCLIAKDDLPKSSVGYFYIYTLTWFIGSLLWLVWLALVFHARPLLLDMAIWLKAANEAILFIPMKGKRGLV